MLHFERRKKGGNLNRYANEHSFPSESAVLTNIDRHELMPSPLPLHTRAKSFSMS